MKKHLLTLAAAGAILSTQAQTTITFEDITLPTNTTYLQQQAADGTYPYTSSTLNLTGNIGWSGTYMTGFNVSNVTDTTDKSYTNSWSVVTGKGHNNSDNYLVTYIELIGANWDTPATLSMSLNAPSANTPIIGGYITNTTWVSDYIKTNYANGDYLKVIFNGYNNGTPTGTPLEITMAEYTATGLNILSDWTYVDFTQLEDVDSVTVTMTTTDLMTPLYFAMDNITISDGVCQDLDTIITNGVYQGAATFSWNNINNAFGTRFEVAVDQSNTPEPAPNAIVYPTLATAYEATGLSAGTTYYIHVRPSCWNDTKGNWYKKEFKTTGTSSVHEIAKDAIKVYPNPATDVIMIETPDFLQATVYNLIGQPLFTSYEKSIAISSLANGNYLMKIVNKEGATITAPFTKK